MSTASFRVCSKLVHPADQPGWTRRHRLLGLVLLFTTGMLSISCTSSRNWAAQSSKTTGTDDVYRWALSQRYQDNAMARSFKAEVRSAFETQEKRGTAEFEQVDRTTPSDVQVGLWNGPRRPKMPIYSKSEFRQDSWVILLNANAPLAKGKIYDYTTTELSYIFDNDESSSSNLMGLAAMARPRAAKPRQSKESASTKEATALAAGKPSAPVKAPKSGAKSAPRKTPDPPQKETASKRPLFAKSPSPEENNSEAQSRRMVATRAPGGGLRRKFVTVSSKSIQTASEDSRPTPKANEKRVARTMSKVKKETKLTENHSGPEDSKTESKTDSPIGNLLTTMFGEREVPTSPG